jgi:hypothetical protein
MDAEGELLRHRVRGIIEAAEGRAAHLLANAHRDADEARRQAATEALGAVTAAEHELRSLLRRLSDTAARLEATLDGRSDRTPGSPHGHVRFARASMRERPVAALFRAAGEAERDTPAARRLG